jgi:hypothetical protein
MNTTTPPNTPPTAPLAPRNEPWTFTVEAVGAGPPTVVRVRRLLKAALRAYGLRCIGYGIPPAPPAHQEKE